MSGTALLPLGLVAVTALALARGDRRALPAALVLAPAAAFGALSLAFFAWRFAGGTTSAFAPAAWLLLAGTAAWAAYRWIARRPEVAPPALRLPASRLVLVSVAVGLVAAVVAGWLQARQMPVGSFDASAIWSSRARLLYLSDDLPELFSILRRPHPDYPFFLPAALAGQFSMLGTTSRLIPLWTGALFPFAAAGAVALGASRLGAPSEWAWAGAALLLATPQMTYWGFAQCADVPVAYLLALAALGLALLTDPARRTFVPPWAAGFLAGLLVWTKNEGMILSLALLGLYGLFAVGSPAGRKRLAGVVLGALLPWMAVAAFKLGWHPRSDLSELVSQPFENVLSAERWRYVLGSFLQRFDPVSGFFDWGLVWPVAAIALLAGWRTGAWRRRPVTFLGVALGACWLAWVGIFIATPLDVQWHVRTALERLMLQLLPLTLMTAAACVRPESASEDAPGDEN